MDKGWSSGVQGFTAVLTRSADIRGNEPIRTDVGGGAPYVPPVVFIACQQPADCGPRDHKLSEVCVYVCV